MRTLAIDPGRCTGWAWGRGGCLGGCGVLRLPEDDAEACKAVARFVAEVRPDRVVAEAPQAYPHRRSRVDVNDLFALSMIVGAAAGVAARLEKIPPRRWKGQIPKPARARDWASYLVHRRNLQSLALAEVQAYSDALWHLPWGLRHNLADAVGILLWDMGRALQLTRGG